MSQQAKIVDLSSEYADEVAKIVAHEADTSGAAAVDNEWLLLCEFAERYGWEAYKAAKNDEIMAAEMLTMIEGGRILDYRRQFRHAEAVLAGSVSAFSGKPDAFKKLTREIIKKTKVQE